MIDSEIKSGEYFKLRTNSICGEIVLDVNLLTVEIFLWRINVGEHCRVLDQLHQFEDL